MTRGIIASGGKVKFIPGGFKSQGGLTAAEIRYYVLYWDKVIIPTSNFIHYGFPDERELAEAEILERPKYIIPSGRMDGAVAAKAMIDGQARIAKELMNSDSKVNWTLHQFSSEIIIPEDLSVELQTIRFELANSLPVPRKEVPIHEVLDFKYRRSDELKNLHNSLDSIFSEIMNDPEPSEMKRIAVRRLIDSIREVNLAASEKWKSNLKVEHAVELNWTAIAAGAASTAATASLASQYITPLQTAIAAAAVAFNAAKDIIKITTKATKSFEPARKNSKLAYLGGAMSEGIFDENPKNGFALSHSFDPK